MKQSILYLFLSLGFLILFLNCKDRSVTPPEATTPEISDVELSIEQIIVNDTVLITVNLSEELGEEYVLKWQLSGYQTEIDTITSEAVFSWKTPKVHGMYEHSVQVVSVTGEAVSEVYLFSTDISSVPVEPVEGNKLVFSMPESDEDNQIFSMNLDGTELTQLTFFERGEAYEPAWSPDGRKIVFTGDSLSTSLGLAIYIMDQDGSNVKPMKTLDSSLPAVYGSNPKWSPDGTMIVFWAYTNFNNEIFVYNFETDSVIQLTTHSAFDRHPYWSPDSKQIVFNTNRDYYLADSMRYRSDLYTMDVHGEKLQRLTETGFAARPNWQLKSKFIAFEWARNGNNVFLFDLITNQIQEVETNLEFEASPKWSKSSELLYIHGREDESSKPEVQIYDFSQDAPLLINKYQDIEAYWYGIDFDWYNYKE